MAITDLSQLDLKDGVYTYADYLTWQFEQAVELIKGKIWPMAAPSRRHQAMSRFLIIAVDKALKNNPCHFYPAPFDVRLHDSTKPNKGAITVIQPDICIVCDESKLDDKGCNGAPDLVIEILSPGNSTKEMKVKKALYEQNNIREYLIVDPEREVVFQFYISSELTYSKANIYTPEDPFNSIIFPELTIDLQALFAAK